MREHILTPLGMKATDFEYSSEAMVANAAAPATSLPNREAMITIIDDARGLGDATSFFRENDEDTAWMSHFIVGEAAGGGLMGPATDMVRYGQMLVNGGELDGVRILSSESVGLLRQEQFSSTGEPLGFGMAWLIRENPEHPYIEHGGGGEGVDALLRVYLDDGFAIALQANSGGYSRQEMMDAAANVVITMLGGGPPPQEQPTPVSTPTTGSAVDEYVDPQGRFRMPLIGDWTAVETDGTYGHIMSAEPPLDLYLVAVESDDLSLAAEAALRQVVLDPAGLTITDSGDAFGPWNLTYYSLEDDKGVTTAAQSRDGITYVIIVTGDFAHTSTVADHVVRTIGGFALSGVDVLPSTVEEFEAYVGEVVGDIPPALSMAISLGADVIYANGFGVADGPRGMVAEADTVYQWGSVAKIVTAVATMQLYEQGLVDLDAPVADYLDYFPAEHGITVRYLLNHSAGLPEPPYHSEINVRLDGQPLADADLIDRTHYETFTAPSFEPGSSAAYSNVHYVTLGQIVATVSGQPYVEYVREHILKPLGLANTDFNFSETMIAKAAAGAVPAAAQDPITAALDEIRGLGDGADYFRESDGHHAWVNRYNVLAAHGGLIGPATEMIRLAQMLLNDGALDGIRILSPESVALMQEMQLSTDGTPLGYSLGWEVYHSGDRYYIAHPGGGSGLQACLRLYPNEGFAIALMSNAGGYDYVRVVDAAANVVITMQGGGPPPAGAQGPPADLPAEQALQGLVDQQVEDQGILGMGMAVRMADGTILGTGSGFTDPEDLDVWNIETVSAVGSITKTFTAVLIMQLVEEGKLSLDDTVDAWFPDISKGDAITIRMLLSHTSGLANYISGENVMEGKWHSEWTAAELVNEAISLGFVAEPGSEDAHYSNTTYIMLGLIIEAITGNSWDEEIEARITLPLGMTNTTFLSAEGVNEIMVGGYGKTEGGFANALYEPWYPHPSTAWSAGEIVTTVSDLTTFASALLDGELVSRESLGDMATPMGFEQASGRDWGLGGAVITEGDMVAFGMGGDIPGFHAFFIGVLDANFVVAAACNTQGGDVITPSLGALQYIMGAVGE